MSNFAKKVLSVVSGAAVVAAAIVPAGVSAAMTSLEAANALGNASVIVSQSDASAYRLGDATTREELSKVIVKLGNLDVTEGESVFQDADFADWSEKYAKALNEAGYAASNAYFNPKRNASKIEALKWVMEARDIESGSNSDWRAARVEGAVAAGIATSFSDYDTNATRGQVFIWAAEALALETAAEDEDFWNDLIGGIDEEPTTEEPTTEEPTDTTPVVTGNGDLMVSLSPETPVSATVPGDISGLAVATFDFTAGAEDVTLSSLVLKRTGLSDANTLNGLAAFTDDGRASKAKNDSQENDTEATLTLSDGGVVVQAGETTTITIVADIEEVGADNAADADGTFATSGSEFAIQLIEVTATAAVDLDSNLVGNTMKLGGVNAAGVTIENDGSVSDVKVGDEGVEIFKFKVEGSSTEDVVLNSITFKGEGSIDEEDELSNYQLEFDGSVVATAEANGKYVTFNLGEGVTIAEGQTEKFSVLANIDAGVSETIAFKVDKTLDVSAEGTKFGFGASVNINDVDAADGVATPSNTVSTRNELGLLSVDAGELTLVDMDAPSDKIRADKDNVELGSIKVTNVSGAPLELQSFAVDVTVSAGTLATTFENFEVEINGTAYELEAVTGGYSDTDLTVSLPEGVTTMVLQADTKDGVAANTKVTVAISNIGTTGFKAVEIEEETTVSDITPSSISFKDLEFIAAGATISGVPLSDVTVVRGSEGIVAHQFQLEASEASMVEVDEVQVTLNGYETAAAQVDTITFTGTETDAANEVLTTTITDAGGTSTFTTTVTASTAATAGTTVVSAVTNVDSTATYTVAEAAGVVTITSGTVGLEFSTSTVITVNGGTDDILSTSTTAGLSTLVADTAANKVISSVALYKGSISEANKLDEQSGSKIAAGGIVTLDGFKTTIAADATQDFIVVLDIVDGVDSVNKTLSLDITTVSAEDDDGDDVTVNTLPLTNNKDIVVTNAGTLITPVLDLANEDNEFDKLALAGNSTILGSFDVRANNEEIDVETVTFTIDGATNLAETVVNATLLLDGVVIATNSNSDITDTSVLFDDLDNLFIPTTTSELALRFNTASIGKDLVGVAQTGVSITQLVLSDAEGVDSGKSVTNGDSTVLATGKTLDIVSAVVTPSVVNTFGTDDQTAELRLVVDGGNNTTALGDAVQAELTVLTFDVSSITSAGNVTVFNSNGTQVGTTGISAPAVAVAATATSATAGDLLATADATGVAANGATVTIVVNDALNATATVTAETATAITVEIDSDSNASTFDDVVTALNLAGTFGATITSPANGADAVVAGDAQVMTLAGGSDAVVSSQTVAVTLGAADSIGNDNETYRIENTAEAVVRLAKNGVTYTINGGTATTTKLENTLELGQYANSN